ncbi:MAG: hypothetical protein R2827_06560 [Bdellovibrionales bacterium]
MRFEPIKFFFILVCTNIAIHSYAASKNTSPPKKPPAKKESRLEKTRDEIAQGVREFSSGIDHFFSAERSEVESNSSYIKLRTQGIFEQYEKADLDFKITGHLSLPKTEEKLQLIVESEDESNQDSGEAQTANPNQDTEQSTTSAGLRYFFDEKYGFKWHADGGVRIDSGLDPFVRTQLRRSTFRGNWEYRFVETVEWIDSTGLSARTEFIFDRPFLGRFLFRQYNGMRWRESGGLYDAVP